MSILRKSAKGRGCQIRVPGVCNFNPETTVLSHLNTGGIGQKEVDLLAAFSCSSCHDVVDFRVPSPFSLDDIKIMHFEGVCRTQKIWLKEGLINILRKP